MRLEHGDVRVEKTDDLNWTLLIRGVLKKDTKTGKAGDERWRAVSYHATLDHALEAACRWCADRHADTWTEYLRQIRETWIALKAGGK